ncbi:hypothetical protein CMALT430_240130 [Carnobacterium maltaromaticum]|nr:hypothetical protein CMALT430_240130 [Carnobacterium maltaromaticum]
MNQQLEESENTVIFFEILVETLLPYIIARGADD